MGGQTQQKKDTGEAGGTGLGSEEVPHGTLLELGSQKWTVGVGSRRRRVESGSIRTRPSRGYSCLEMMGELDNSTFAWSYPARFPFPHRLVPETRRRMSFSISPGPPAREPVPLARTGCRPAVGRGLLSPLFICTATPRLSKQKLG